MALLDSLFTHTNRIPADLPLDRQFIGLSQTGLGYWLLPTIAAYLLMKEVGMEKKKQGFVWPPVLSLTSLNDTTLEKLDNKNR